MSKFPTLISVAAIAVLALAGCATNTAETAEVPAAQVATEAPVETPEATPSPAAQPEMPGWAQEMHWFIYPDGFECAGTEGCGNDYVLTFGEPGPVLPDNVEYYDPEKHECTVVFPAGVDCFR